MLELLIPLISGAVGGNVAGGVSEKLNQGTLINSISGIVGGGLGGTVMNMMGMASGAGGMDIGSIISQVASGGIGGGVVLAVVGVIKGMISK